jgi:dual specificity phosphatase 12
LKIGNEKKKYGKLFLGDRFAASYVQLKFRNCKSVISCSSELHAFSKEPDVKYLNIDPEDASSNHFEEALEFIDSEILDGRNVVVHCENGNGKSAAIIIYYAMKKNSISLSQSYTLVKGFKPDIKPRPFLINILIEAEKQLRGSNTVMLQGKNIVFLDSKNKPSKILNRNSNSNPALYVLLGVSIFFVFVFGVLVLVTGKL